MVLGGGEAWAGEKGWKRSSRSGRNSRGRIGGGKGSGGEIVLVV